MLVLVEGWTGTIDCYLVADGAAYDLTGATVTLLLFTVDGGQVTLGGSVAISSPATAGHVTYSPAVGDMYARYSPYRVRFKVVDGLGKVRYFPTANTDIWNVVGAAG